MGTVGSVETLGAVPGARRVTVCANRGYDTTGFVTPEVQIILVGVGAGLYHRPDERRAKGVGLALSR